METVFNPLLWLFLSYALGVLATEGLKMTGAYEQLADRHVLSDDLTRRLGVLHLGRLIRHTFLRRFNPRLQYAGGFRRAELQQLKADMTYAEVNHLLGFFLFAGFIIWLAVRGIAAWQIAGYALVNVVFNGYLVLLQQYNKRRIGRILDRRPA